MSTFEQNDYKWRETYFVLFHAEKRPTLEAVAEALQGLNDKFELTNATADEDGGFESLTLRSPQDYAALDISYVSGEEVLEQGAALAEEMKSFASDAQERAKLKRLTQCDARLDVMHFEQVIDSPAEDELDEMLDPSTLLIALDVLVELTGGIGVDPQSGALM